MRYLLLLLALITSLHAAERPAKPNVILILTDDPRWPGHKLSENNFLISYPDGFTKNQKDKKYSESALKVTAP